MSFTAWIDITFVHFEAADAIRVIDTLLAFDWSYNCFNHIEYLPPGDGDDFAWQHVPLDAWGDVQTILQQKTQNAEQVGIGLTYQASERGGTFVIKPQGELLMMLFVDRPTITSTMAFLVPRRTLTDFRWYVERMVVPLMAAGFRIESIQYSDIN